MTGTNKVLFVGCSFTSECGFTEQNRQLHHWPILFSNHYGVSHTNIAIGGMSNDEIFHRTIEELEKHDYQYVVIMWSEIQRYWEYFKENNVDDFTMLNGGNLMGFNANDKLAQEYAMLHYSLFNNTYVKLKKWLINIIALDSYLSHRGVPYVFIKGFENGLSDYKGTVLTDTIKDDLDFHNRPDDYIATKIDSIKSLITKVENCQWLNFDSKSFFDSMIDVSDDGIHPGKRSNKELVDKLITHCGVDLLNSSG